MVAFDAEESGSNLTSSENESGMIWRTDEELDGSAGSIRRKSMIFIIDAEKTLLIAITVQHNQNYGALRYIKIV